MANIQNLLSEQNFETFDELLPFVQKYHLDIKHNNDLFMLCFNNETDLNIISMRECTGIIFEKKKPFNKIVHVTFPKCYDDYEDYNNVNVNSNIITKDIVTLFFQGTIIKLYYYNNNWNIATSNHLDASENTWSSNKTFEELFIECVTTSYPEETYYSFLNGLSPKCCYSYLIQHPENKQTIKIYEALLFEINKINLDTLHEYADIEFFKVDKTVEEIVNSENRHICDNYLILKLNEDLTINSRIKLLSPEFLKLKEIEGNQPNPGLRIIELLHSYELQEEFIRAFPEHHELCNKINNMFKITRSKIHELYFNIHIKKLEIEIPIKFNRILYQMHCRYKKLKCPITKNDISDKLLSLNVRTIANIIGYTY